MKNFKGYIKQILLSFFVSLTVLIADFIILTILVKKILFSSEPGIFGLLGSPEVFFPIVIIGTMFPSLLFSIWIYKDSRKNNARGTKIAACLWGVGVLFPTSFIVLPFYLIKRNILWIKDDNVLEVDVA